MDAPGSRTLTSEAILADLVSILEDMTADWDLGLEGPIGPDTKLVAELGFESIDVVQLIVDDQLLAMRGNTDNITCLAFSRYVDEILVRDCVAFLHRHLNR